VTTRERTVLKGLVPDETHIAEPPARQRAHPLKLLCHHAFPEKQLSDETLPVRALCNVW
jgi:hypothetical protein